MIECDNLFFKLKFTCDRRKRTFFLHHKRNLLKIKILHVTRSFYMCNSCCMNCLLWSFVKVLYSSSSSSCNGYNYNHAYCLSWSLVWVVSFLFLCNCHNYGCMYYYLSFLMWDFSFHFFLGQQSQFWLHVLLIIVTCIEVSLLFSFFSGGYNYNHMYCSLWLLVIFLFFVSTTITCIFCYDCLQEIFFPIIATIVVTHVVTNIMC